MPSLPDVAHDGVFCTFIHLVIDQPQTGASGLVRHGQNHSQLGHSPPAIQAGRRFWPVL
jgi:hypothetical protein